MTSPTEVTPTITIDMDQATLKVEDNEVNEDNIILPMSRRRKVVFIYDDPKGIKDTFEWAIENVLRKGKDYVTILDTYTTDPASKGLSVTELWNLTAGTDDFADLDNKLKKEEEIVNEHIDRLRHTLSTHQILSQKLTIHGNDPRAKVIEILQSQKPELVIIGQSHMSFLQRTIYGTFEDYLIRYSECSVTVVKTKPHPYQ